MSKVKSLIAYCIISLKYYADCTLPQVGNWGRWLSDFLGMDTDSSAQDVNATLENDDKQGTNKPKSFPLLHALSDLLMLPKDMLMDRTIRMEVSRTKSCFVISPCYVYHHLIHCLIIGLS